MRAPLNKAWTLLESNSPCSLSTSSAVTAAPPEGTRANPFESLPRPVFRERSNSGQDRNDLPRGLFLRSRQILGRQKNKVIDVQRRSHT